jgi:hypothetical protein
MSHPVPILVSMGVMRVRIEVAAIPIKNILFPPNLVAKKPPGIWVKM